MFRQHLICLICCWSLLWVGGASATLLFRGSSRSLQTTTKTYQVTLTWQLDVEGSNLQTGQVVVDRTPTLREYIGVQTATEAWLSRAFTTAFAKPDSLTCQVGAKSWHASKSDTDYPHNIQLICVIASNAVKVSLTQFVLTLNQNAKVFDFLKNYLPNYGPSSSIFRAVTRAAYGLQAESSGTGTTGGSAPTAAPAVASVTPSDFTNRYRVPLDWTWFLTLDKTVTDRAASSTDLAGLVKATENWLQKSMKTYFASNPYATLTTGTSKPVPTSAFDHVKVTLQTGTTWNKNANYTHKVPVRVETYFAANNVLDVPTGFKLIGIMRDHKPAFSTLDFLLHYLRTVYTNSAGTSTVSNYLFAATSGILYQVNLANSYLGTIPTTNGAPELVTSGNQQSSGSGGGSVSGTVTMPNTGGGSTSTTTGGSSSTTTNVWTVTVPDMILRYATSGGRAATQSEWNGLLQQTNAFLQQALSNHYKNTGVTFVKVQGALVDKAYVANGLYQQRGTFDVTLTFGAPKASTGMLAYQTLLVGLFTAGSQNYMGQYVRKAYPTDSVFRATSQIAWGF